VRVVGSLQVGVGVEVVVGVIKRRRKKKEKSVARHVQEAEAVHGASAVSEMVEMVVDLGVLMMALLQESFVIIGCELNHVSMKMHVVFHTTSVTLFLG